MTFELPDGWTNEAGCISRTWQVKGFSGAQQLAGVVAYVANRVNHHPSIEMHDYNQVTVRSVTHDKDAVTDADIELAKRINATITAADGGES